MFFNKKIALCNKRHGDNVVFCVCHLKKSAYLPCEAINGKTQTSEGVFRLSIHTFAGVIGSRSYCLAWPLQGKPGYLPSLLLKNVSIFRS